MMGWVPDPKTENLLVGAQNNGRRIHDVLHVEVSLVSLMLFNEGSL